MLQRYLWQEKDSSLKQSFQVFQVRGGEKRMFQSWIRRKQEWGDRDGLAKLPAADGAMYW